MPKASKLDANIDPHTPKPSTIKKLFAYSGNQCAMPNCKAFLIDESGTVLAKIAHICAASNDGPRADKEMSNETRRSYENLIVICGPCHDIIDDPANVPKYSAEDLRSFKAVHEKRFKNLESQLLQKYQDTTQIAAPKYPSTLKSFYRELEYDDDMIDEDLPAIIKNIDKLRELPLQQRSFALSLAQRLLRNGKSRLSTKEVENAFNIESQELLENLLILDDAGFGGYEQSTDNPNITEVMFYSRDFGENIFIEIAQFCEKTETDPNELIRDLNFSIFD